MAMLFIIYASFLVDAFFKNTKINELLINLCSSLIIVLLFMFIVGYFEADFFGSISRGYGKFGLDLFGIFDPQINNSNLNDQFNDSHETDSLPHRGSRAFRKPIG